MTCTTDGCTDTARVFPVEMCLDCASALEPHAFGAAMTRIWCMPNKWTFEMEPVERLLHQYMQPRSGLWIDPFAGRSNLADVTNDFDPEKDTDYTMEATDFLQTFEDDAVDGGVLFDPPYSYEQVKRAYDNIGDSPSQEDTSTRFYALPKDEIERICADGAYVISFGWDSNGVGSTRDFEREEVMLLSHGAGHNDTICTVEVYHG